MFEVRAREQHQVLCHSGRFVGEECGHVIDDAAVEQAMTAEAAERGKGRRRRGSDDRVGQLAWRLTIPRVERHRPEPEASPEGRMNHLLPKSLLEIVGRQRKQDGGEGRYAFRESSRQHEYGERLRAHSLQATFAESVKQRVAVNGLVRSRTRAAEQLTPLKIFAHSTAPLFPEFSGFPLAPAQ